MVEEARCPECNVRILWDWEQDAYWLFEKERYVAQVHSPGVEFADSRGVKDEKKITLHVCDCRTVLAVSVEDEYGMHIHNHPDLNHIDWGNDSNMK